MIPIYFFDTYALIELYRGNKQYEPYKDKGMVITYLNLIEFDYFLLKTKADRNLFTALKDFVVAIKDEDVKKANEFKLRHQHKNLSFVDCVGYIIAKRLGIKFLTGNQQFEDFDNVEFIK